MTSSCVATCGVGSTESMESKPDLGGQIAQCQFADDIGMHKNVTIFKQLLKRRVALPQEVHPDRGINQHHNQFQSAWPATPDALHTRLGAPKRRKPARSLSLDERFQRKPYQSCFFTDPRQLLGLRQ